MDIDVQDLENKIKYYAQKYYEGSPVIDDNQFDSLVDKLRSIKPESDVLVTGWGFDVNGDKVKHKYSHIGSLDKCKSYIEIPERFKGKCVYISPKLDGLSAVAYYKNGKLIKGITRGNGEYGKDITEKLIRIIGSNIPDSTFTGAVRGELIINETNWNILKDKYANQEMIAPRNFAAGIINRKDIDEDIKYIDLVVYKIVGHETQTPFTTRREVLGWLNGNFINAIPIYCFDVLTENVWEEEHTKLFNQFKTNGYELDGLVLTDSTVPYDYSSMSYMWNEVAFKFAAESTDTIIKDIEWTLSRTQRLVPVCVVEPVVLSGANIERVTGNNAQMVNDLGLGIGAEVSITRSNEVIPKILEVINPSNQELPSKCPVCGSQLQWVGVDLKCTNPQCPNIELSNLQQWCESIGETDGLQWTLMKQYLDKYHINSIRSLYSNKDIVMSDLTTRQLSITEQKIYNFFNKLYVDKVSSYKALVALNIPRLGDKTSKLLCTEQSLILDYYKYIVNMINGVPNQDITPLYNRFIDIVKQATQMSIWENSDKFINLGYLLKDNRVEFESKTNEQNVQYVAVTGSLITMKRKDFEQHINKFGYELCTNLKKCKYLITNNPDSGSSKNKQAIQYNVPIITEQQFLAMLK